MHVTDRISREAQAYPDKGFRLGYIEIVIAIEHHRPGLEIV